MNRWSVKSALDRNRGDLAAVEAECGDAAPEVLRLQRMQQRHDQPRAGGADRMAERAGAAMDVEPVAGNGEIALGRHSDHRERPVELEQVDGTEAPAGLVGRLAD